ncbi:general substrate transporter [Sphaerosporella brunnea]|uniref:General substrate transporter n=1 Tax=Sphaerosporella brunnea TaxID=1250544 RepID=A0A5J5EQU8_9PEZI|nr:general substrate transporter [Sphaerosporella brunnea]
MGLLFENRKVFFIALFASLGGLLYGYEQGVLSQALVMTSFGKAFPEVRDASKKGWMTSILQLGGWLGALLSGYFAERWSRKHAICGSALSVVLGSYLQAGASNARFVYAGRWFTGLGVGSLSSVGPLYNAELAPPEARGLLVALQQLSIAFGIMVSFWIGYGTNYIGGTGDGQSDWSWRIPMITQGIPAIALAIGVWFLPFSPRLLVSKGREEEAIAVLCSLRKLPADDPLIRTEFLEIKAEAVFQREVLEEKFPHLTNGDGWADSIKLELAQYGSFFKSWHMFKRLAIGCLVMFFQQWTGIDAVIYYAPTIFSGLGLSGKTTSLLATGVVGVVFVLVTLPTVLVIDKVGRRPICLAGSFGMFTCLTILAILVGRFQHSWDSHPAAGWVCVACVWIYAMNFGYSWGPASWILISEIFPVSVRAKGTSISASSNWMNNFIIAFVVPPMLETITYGTYIFFAVFTLMGAGFIFWFVPETANKSLEDMDRVFGSNVAEREAEWLRAVQERVGLTEILNNFVGEEKREIFEDLEEK